ncbi:MAG TPA: hypothetical protein PLW19_06615, partial [Anaerolineaceae bacterium]|nr:hypothetical protein [Anaerolineaceae bacterium]
MKVKRRTIVYYVKKHLFHFLILIFSAVILSFLSLAPIPLLGKLTDILSTKQAVYISFFGLKYELDIWRCFFLIGFCIFLNSMGLNFFG